MNDERIVAKQSIIKRNNLVIILLISLIFLIVKLILKQDFVTYLSDIYLLVTSILVLLIAKIYKRKQEIVDERVVQKQLLIYSKGFVFIVLSGTILYFITCVFFDYSEQFIIQPNVSINLMFSICLILSYINTRRNDFTFNYKIIESDKKTYYKNVMINIGKGLLFALGIGLLVNALRIFGSTQRQMIDITSVSLIISFMTMSFQYYIFSIYERLHSEEKYEIFDGRYRYVSRKSLFLFILCAIHVTYLGFISLLVNFIRNISESTSEFTDFLLYIRGYLELLYLKLIISGITYVIILLLSRLIIRKSIERALNFKKNILRILTISIWVVFGFDIILWMFNVIINTGIVHLLFSEWFSSFYSVYSILNIIYMFIMLFFYTFILVIMYWKKIEYKKLYLCIFVVMVLQYILPRVSISLGFHMYDGIDQGVFFSRILSFVLTLTISILTIIFLSKLTKVFEIEQESKAEINLEN